jgi:hypothetical protein
MAKPRNPTLEELFFQGRRYTRKPGRRSFYCNEWDRKQKRYTYRAYHRDVWSDTHGPIPPNCDIHHTDGDWNNNVLENFECITRSDHHRLHSNEPSFKRTMRAWLKRNKHKIGRNKKTGCFFSKSRNPVHR